MTEKSIIVVSAAIQREGKYLITQRTERAVLPLLWEFPGGKVESGEVVEEALARELSYRLGVKATVGERLSVTKKDYETYCVELHLYHCEIGADEPKPLTVRDLRWVALDELEGYDFPPADKASMDQLLFGSSDE